MRVGGIRRKYKRLFPVLSTTSSRLYLLYCWIVSYNYLLDPSVSYKGGVEYSGLGRSRATQLASMVHVQRFDQELFAQLECKVRSCTVVRQAIHRPKWLHKRGRLTNANSFTKGLMLILISAGSFIVTIPTVAVSIMVWLPSSGFMVSILCHASWIAACILIVMKLCTEAPVASSGLIMSNQCCPKMVLQHWLFNYSCSYRPLVVIFTLLLIAGDVEVNPGPGRYDSQADQDPAQPLGESAAIAEEGNGQTSRTMMSNIEQPVAAEVVQLNPGLNSMSFLSQSLDVNSYAYKDSVRASEPSQMVTLPIQQIDEVGDHKELVYNNSVRDSESSQATPLPIQQTDKEGDHQELVCSNSVRASEPSQATPLPIQQEGDHQELMCNNSVRASEPNQASPLVVEPIQQTNHGSTEESSEQEFILVQGLKTVVRQTSQTKRKSRRYTATPSELRKQFKIEQQGIVCSLLEKVENLDQLNPAEASRKLFDLFSGANKLYRLGEKCPVCPMCLKMKSEVKQQQKGGKKKAVEEKQQKSSKQKKTQRSGGHRHSHVIPECILHNYWMMHSSYEQTDYIFDFSRNERLAAGSLTYQLLCGNCEDHYSVSENYLLSLYIYIAGKPDVNFVFPHKTGEDTSWLRYILANIVFRGILVNVDLYDECFKEQEVISKIYSLWEFCAGKSSSPPNLKVFLLPNKPFNEQVNDFMYPFEMLIRMPRCTELVKQSEGTFFYTKFDCFHIVFPICETSEIYFETFRNGVIVEGQDLQLRWSVHPKTELSREGKMIKLQYHPDHTDLRKHFPEVLLSWCASLYQTYVSRAYNQPLRSPLREPFLTGLERYHDCYQYVGFDTTERMRQTAISGKHETVHMDDLPNLTMNYEDLVHLNDRDRRLLRDTCVLDASKSSPLRLRKGRNEESEETHKAKVAELERTLGNVQEDLGATREELGNLKEKYDLTKEKLETLQSCNEDQEMEISKLRERLGSTTSDLGSTRAELGDLKSENEGLKKTEQSHRRKLEICRAELDHFRFLYYSTLRHSESNTAERIKECIEEKAADMEYVAHAAQDTEIHQEVKKVHETYKRLISVSPPSSPTSPLPYMLNTIADFPL